jgi:hypothetical protein
MCERDRKKVRVRRGRRTGEKEKTREKGRDIKIINIRDSESVAACKEKEYMKPEGSFPHLKKL